MNNRSNLLINNTAADWLGGAPVISESDITNTYETEVLVIGCGCGGMFTICSAAEEGVRVIGIDQFATGTGIRMEREIRNLVIIRKH